ncbi:MAG: PRC-barrel domain-containing protein [Candidatus Thorarchaeota archaeon]|jgi:sporulation protein YlmC with PRC-barrel domain
MNLTRSICSRDIKKIEVLDTTGEVIGKVTDLTITFDGNLRLSKFILAGSRWQEFLESIKIRPNRDPVVDGALIDQMDDHLHLNTTLDSLKTTLDDEAIVEGEIRLSQLEKMDIVDKDDKKVGRALAVNFDLDGSVSIIVGGGFIEEKLEAAGLKADVDIIVPGHTITSIAEKIQLNVSDDELRTTMDDALKNKDIENRRREKAVFREVTKVRLFSHRPM